MAKFSALVGDEREEVITYVKGRWTQYSAATRETRKDAATFIAAINAGGAVAVLAFTGSIMKDNPALAKALPLKLAISFFALGVLLSALAHVIEYARVNRLFAKWRTEVDRLYANTLDFDDMQHEDVLRSGERARIPTTCIVLALVCFAAGAGAGIGLLFLGG